MTFQIRQSVELPPISRPQATSKYPLRDLPIGGGFFIPGAKKSAQVTLAKAAKTAGVTITTRRMQDHATYDDEGNGVGEKVDGLMVKRIAPKA